jgi:hypothetical protein
LGGQERDLKMTRANLQVIVGDAAAGAVLRTMRFKRSDIVADRDHLSCGPLASLAPLSAWRERRDAYWDDVFPLPQEVLARGSGRADPDLVSLSRRPEVLLSAEVVNVWLGVSLDNQLFLAWLLELAPLIGFDPQRIRVVQFERHPVTGEAVMDICELNPEVTTAHPPPVPLTTADVADLRQAWAAIAAPEPSSLVRYIEAHANSPAVFHRAFARILGRFPRRVSGLNRWELELLQRVPKGGITKEALFKATLGECRGELDAVGCVYLSDRLRRLASRKIPGPLLSLEGPPESDSKCIVALTAKGVDVLDGKANFVEVNGIDDWVGGIHLQSATGRVWFIEEDSNAVGAAQPGR